MRSSTATRGAGGEAQSLKYRPGIDGLRAIAVIAVVWFHSGLPGIPGGFTGVDVFFVISGFLITSIIHPSARQGRFSFAYFYQRRFRRIAPALVTVTLAATIAAYALLLPYELDELARSALAAVAMVSNIYFWRTTNYFAFSHSVVPLLHSWSLGVEEQFYLLFPAALVVAERWRRPGVAVAVLATGSFLLCLLLTAPMPAAAFYLLFTRGWELMVGAALALGIIAVPSALRQFGGIAGIVLIVGGFIVISADDPFPGWRALLPTLGAALVIGSGRECAATRALSVAPLVYVGRVSYSLYLWHWPILVFLRHYSAELELPPALAFGGIMLAFLLSAASYRWIEQPARRPSTPFRFVLLPCLAAAVAIVIAAGVAVAGNGLPQRLPHSVDVVASARSDYAPLAHSCTGIGFDAAMNRCHLGRPGPPKVLLWGDSNAAAISEAVGEATDQSGVVISMGACPPVLDWPNGEDPVACRTTNARALRLAEADPRITTVILSAQWPQSTQFWRSEQQVVSRLLAAGKRVAVVAGVPQPQVDVPWVSAIRQRFGRPPLRLDCPPARVPLQGVLLVDVSAGFCGEPAYRLFADAGHPSRHAGSAIIAPAIKRALRSGWPTVAA